MKIKYIVIFSIVALGIYLIIHRNSSSKSPEEKEGPKGPAPTQAMRVDGFVVREQKFQNKISLTGSVEANEQIQIRTQVPGMIEKLYFDEGTSVKKGSILLKIEDSELRARMMEAKTRESLARETERRASLLLEKAAISKEEYEVAQADLRSLEAQTQLISSQLEKTVIRAPFEGKIGLRNVSQGSYLTTDVVIANLVDSDPVKISFSLPEKYAANLNLSSALTFTIAGYKDNFSGKIYAIEPAVNPLTRAIEVKAIADNKEGKILPGAFANVSLSLSNIDKALLIPSQAIVPIQNGKKIFIASNGKAKGVNIVTSVRTEDKVLVESGIQPGDTILTSGVLTLKENTPVKVIIPQKDTLNPVK